MAKKPVKFDEALYNQAVERQKKHGGTIEGNLIQVIKEQGQGTEETPSYSEETQESDIMEYEVLPPVSSGTSLATRPSHAQVLEVSNPGDYVTREEFAPYQRATVATARSHARHLYGHLQAQQDAPRLSPQQELDAFYRELELDDEVEGYVLEDVRSLRDEMTHTPALPGDADG